MDPINQQQPVPNPASSVIPPTMPSETPSTPTVGPTEDKKAGPIIAILVIVLVLVIAALYIFAAQSTVDPIPDDSMMTDEQTAPAEVQPITNTSDDIMDIQADLDASIDGLDDQNF